MEQIIQDHKNSKIIWRRYGQGPQKVICIHGYGEDASKFEFLQSSLGNLYSFYCINLPYHGDTVWNELEEFETVTLATIIKDFFKGDAEASFYLLGYSLGGRIALALYEENPILFKKLILLAPDGFVVNPWYWLATQTSLGNKLFSYTMKKPHWFFAVIKKLNSWKIINDSVFKFAHYYVDDAAARELLYKRWTGLRKFKPSLGKIAKLMIENNTQLRLLYGRFDKIILPAKGKSFCKKIGALGEVKIVPAGHQLLNERIVPEITDALMH
jgi:pimeloyl-ACP methyl ester carboxylesterase